ncbi:MAG: hypothetical protein HC877_21740 [Thioploca sp.]|nr:hypothetical protein [Thioploca sp.]
MITSSTPLSNLQLELLKLFAHNVSEEQLLEIKLLLGQYFAQQATDAMEKVWKEKNLTPQDMVTWVHEHHRV